MRPSQIKPGKTYTGDALAIVQRRVVAVGPGHCPGAHPIPGGVGVLYMLQGADHEGRRVYLDTFAKWAKREVTQ